MRGARKLSASIHCRRQSIDAVTNKKPTGATAGSGIRDLQQS